MREMSKVAEDSRIEISGWDQDDIFFAEIADLSFDPSGEKKIVLRSNLRLRSVVFARPVASVTPGTILPAAYLVMQLRPQDPEGCSEVRLVQICSRSDVSLRAKPASYMPEDSRGAQEPTDGSARWIEEEILR
jgi:hypothetical protein